MSSLPPPAVSPEAYDERYYREMCAGYEEWAATDGAGASGVYAGTLEMARFAPGEVVLDLGTGRGELLAVAVERGAARAIGVEYSPDAVRLARQTLASRGVEDRCEVVLADARDVPLEDGIADLVTLIDVVEHLTPAELDLALAQALRLLAPGGRLIAHTMPNRTVYEVTYRLQRLAWPPRRRRWPADPRNPYEHRMHVNEQTVRSLRSALTRACFADVEAWTGAMRYADFVPDERARALYWRLAARRPTRRLGAFDLWARAIKRGA